MSHWEKAQDTLEGICFSPGLGSRNASGFPRKIWKKCERKKAATRTTTTTTRHIRALSSPITPLSSISPLSPTAAAPAPQTTTPAPHQSPTHRPEPRAIPANYRSSKHPPDAMMRKDLNKPKGKTSAYAFFVQTCREEHRKKNPEQSVNFAEFSKKCSERWKSLTPNDKKVFEDMAKTDKARYNREMKDYIPPKGFGKRGRKRKDPNAPKRPPSAFFVFCGEYRPTVKQQYPGLSIGDCAKKLGEMWSKLGQNDKQPYEEKAQKLREKYDRDMVAYRGGGTLARNPSSSAPGPEEEDDDEGEDEDDEEDDDE